MCPIPSPLAVALLDHLEREERKLLCWGYTEGLFTDEDLAAHAATVQEANPTLCQEGDPDAILDELIDSNWLFHAPAGGGYRTRSAEIVRMLSKLRQIRVFPYTKAALIPTLWQAAPPLVADYRFQAPQRTFPKRDLTLSHLLGVLPCPPRSLQADLLGAFVGTRKLAGFQVRATERILGASTEGGTVVCSGTGSGKTLAFYLPAYMKLAPLLDDSAWTKCIAVYPRNELLKDQLLEAIRNAERIAPVLARHGRRSLTFGALYGDVKENRERLLHPKYGWKELVAGGVTGRVCPFLRCPACGGTMLWTDADRASNTERLQCIGHGCTKELGSDIIRLTRHSLKANPPDILFVSSEMLNRDLSASAYYPLLGIEQPEPHRPRLLLLDEIHTYEGNPGAHMALLLRRWRHLSKARPHVVGLSATLEDAPRFFAELAGLPVGSVAEVGPSWGELESEGADYQLALRGDSSWGTGLLSTTIQTLMLMRRVLEPRSAEPTNLAGSRVFAFSDRLDGINRLLEDLRDAEGREVKYNHLAPAKKVLAGLRDDGLPDHLPRYLAGQSWDLVQKIRRHLALRPTQDSSLVISRTTSQDTGVDTNADIVVATASLEVGYDDSTVGAVIQHKAPISAAAFLQRKGRAGRVRHMRPWTVVVLSDFGKDRAAYQDYEHLFSPTLRPRYLPTRNRALLRMQATYTLFEYLGLRAAKAGHVVEPWTALARPAYYTEREEQKAQSYFTQQLKELLEDRDRQRDFARYLQAALKVTAEEVQAVLWEPPRSVMLEAVPTLYRRLAKNWKRNFEVSEEPKEAYGPPLPEFVQANFFTPLLVPEVNLRLPGKADGEDPKDEDLLLEMALREFAPGRVSKRFDTTGEGGHWLAPADGETMTLDQLVKPGDRAPLGMFTYHDVNGVHEVEVHRPYQLEVTVPDASISPTSSARPQWCSEIVLSGEGYTLDWPKNLALTGLVGSVAFHTHHLGNPVEVRRFVTGTKVALAHAGGRRDPERSLQFVNGAGDPAGLGWQAEVDALAIGLHFPEEFLAHVAGSPELLQNLRPLRFRALLGEETALDGILNSFQRDYLAEAFLAALFLALDANPNLEVRTACEAMAETDLTRALALVIAGEAEVDDDEEGRTVPRRVREMTEALADPVVKERLRAHGAVLWSPVDAAWEPWLRRILKTTLGASLRDAISSVCPDIDEGDLLVEGDGVRPDDASTLWLTESTVGGSGALESFYAAFGRDPRQFARVWHGCLQALEMEKVAVSFERTLDLLAGPIPDPQLGAAIAGLRNAVRNSDALSAVHALRDALGQAGLSTEHAALTAIFARILKPGGTPALDAFLRATLASWNTLEARAGLAIDARLFAHIQATHAGLERLMPPTPQSTHPDTVQDWRRDMLTAWLWTRPKAVRREALTQGNPFVPTLVCDRLIVPMAEIHTQIVALDSADWFEALTEALNQAGIARLRAMDQASGGLADAIRTLVTNPIDTGGLQVFARLTGYARWDGGAEITVEMPEALQ